MMHVAFETYLWICVFVNSTLASFVVGALGATLIWAIVFYVWARDMFKDLWKHS